MNILHRIRRVFTRRQPQPAPRIVYVPERELPADPAELVRLGVIRPWRTECTGMGWYTAEPGAIAWFQKNLRGRAND